MPAINISVRALSLALGILGLFMPCSAHPQNWSSSDAHVTKRDFLEIYFTLHMHRHETEEGANSFNLVSFYPANSAAGAMLVITQTYNDEGKSTENPKNRQTIREVGDSLVREFEALCQAPVISKRWTVNSPSHTIVIKHVRIKDLQDVLAVTLDGVTSFDPEDFKKAEKRVTAAGGVWAW